MITRTSLTSDDLRQFLSHADPFVRRFAAECLKGRPMDQDLADRVMESVRTYGLDESRWVLTDLAEAPFTKEHRDELIGMLEGAHELSCYPVYGVVANAPLDYIKARLERIKKLPHVYQELTDLLQHRISLSSRSVDDIWADILQVSEDYSDDPDADFDMDLITDKIKALVPDTDFISDRELLDLLVDDDTEGEWLEIFVIEFLGQRRSAAAVPFLLSLLQEADAELLTETAISALCRINAVSTVELIKRQYVECDDDPDQRLLLVEVLGKLQVPGVKEALLFLLQQEKDVFIRSAIYYGLCLTLEADAVKVAIRGGRNGDFEPDCHHIRAEVIAPVDMLGLPLPERASWAKERERYDAMMSKKIDETILEAGELKANSSRPQLSVVPSVRATPKVGRNDLCTCGSGKKYKKCCEQTLH